MNKKRIDQLLFEKKIVESRTKAQAMIMAWQIYIDNKQVNKSGQMFRSDAIITVKNLNQEWVSRGALKFYML